MFQLLRLRLRLMALLARLARGFRLALLGQSGLVGQ